MSEIKAFVGYKERTNTRLFREFEVVNSLPVLGINNYTDKDIKEINEVKLDCEQGDDEVFNYNYYEVIYRYLNCKYDNEDETETDYICIEHAEEESEYSMKDLISREMSFIDLDNKMMLIGYYSVFDDGVINNIKADLNVVYTAKADNISDVQIYFKIISEDNEDFVLKITKVSPF